MGINTSKTNKNESSIGVLKNDLETCDNPDPRSPTPEIVRTPLQNKPGSKHNITKNMDLRKTFENCNGEEKLVHNNPILSAVIKNHLQSYDPRSPTQDFERTPIVITSKRDDSNDKLLELEVENCSSPVLKDECGNEDSCVSCAEAEASEKGSDLVVARNLCAGFYDLTLNDTLLETEAITASSIIIENDILQVDNKSTELLETNFDYVENENDKYDDSEENMEANQEFNKIVENLKNIPVLKCLKEDPRSPSIGIERTPIVVAEIQVDESEGNVEYMSDDTLIKVLQNTNIELRQTKPDKNKEGLLIYEDDADVNNLNDTPKKSKSARNSSSRTPLSCMKNTTDASSHTRSKSANTLCDPKSNKNRQSKIPKRISHIPRLKCLTKQQKFMQTGSSVSLKNISKTVGVGGDCENTPPHSHRDKWDKDSSIVL